MIKEDSQSKYYKLFLGCKAELRGWQGYPEG
jgi:hypothetical protein